MAKVVSRIPTFKVGRVLKGEEDPCKPGVSFLWLIVAAAAGLAVGYTIAIPD